jgi:hypothetical protein
VSSTHIAFPSSKLFLAHQPACRNDFGARALAAQLSERTLARPRADQCACHIPRTHHERTKLRSGPRGSAEL